MRLRNSARRSRSSLRITPTATKWCAASRRPARRSTSKPWSISAIRWAPPTTRRCCRGSRRSSPTFSASTISAAGSVEADKVIPAVEALKYDYYKGSQYYRKCDHQSVQSVLIIESKATDPKNEADVFNVISTEEPNEANLRTCAALGHKA